MNKEEEQILDPSKRGNSIFRQELKTLTPNCNIKCSIICNLSMMVIFFIFGGAIVGSSNSIVSQTIDYTFCNNIVTRAKPNCVVTFNLTQTIPQPVFIYYELDGFYKNYRSYVSSRDYAQQRGDYATDSSNLKKCNGAKTNGEIFDYDKTRYKNPWGNLLNETENAIPCGLIAKSYFNDTFAFQNTNITINETGIANPYDLKYYYKNTKNYTVSQWLDMENEHFPVWMMMETFPHFRKLWGRITQDLNPGNYSVNITNYYNVSNVTKSLVISNASALGYSPVFGYFLIAGGCLCFIFIVVVLILWKLDFHKVSEEKDPSKLKWD